MVCLDASRRISAADALCHRYFRSDPPPSTVDQLPKPAQRGVEAAGVAGQAGPGAGQADAQPAAQREEQTGGTDASQGGSLGPSRTRHKGPEGGAPPSATPPFGGQAAEAVPESLLGRGARPKLDSSDMTFFKKRKFNLDDALAEGGEEQPGSTGYG